MKKRDTYMLIGFILVAFSLFILFKSTRIYTWGFYRIWNGVSTGGIIIALILLDVVLYVATKSKVTKVLLPILIAMLVLSMILGTHLAFTGSLLDLLLILIPMAVGAGLLLKVFVVKKEE